MMIWQYVALVCVFGAGLCIGYIVARMTQPRPTLIPYPAHTAFNPMRRIEEGEDPFKAVGGYFRRGADYDPEQDVETALQATAVTGALYTQRPAA